MLTKLGPQCRDVFSKKIQINVRRVGVVAIDFWVTPQLFGPLYQVFWGVCVVAAWVELNTQALHKSVSLQLCFDRIQYVHNAGDVRVFRVKAAVALLYDVGFHLVEHAV